MTHTAHTIAASAGNTQLLTPATPLYAGIDLHSNNCVLALMDAQGKVIANERLPNSLPLLLQKLQPLAAQLHSITVEATYNAYWLTDGLHAAALPIQMTHPAALKQYEGIKHRNDYSDAAQLANYARLGILPVAHLYTDKPLRALRDTLRRRRLIVHQTTQQALSLQCQYSRLTGQGITLAQLRQLDPEHLPDTFNTHDTHGKPTPWHTHERTAFCTVLTLHRAHSSIVAHLEHEVELALLQQDGTQDDADTHTSDMSTATRKHTLQALRTLPGVGPLLSATILLETGDIRRFPNGRHYASYCRCVGSAYTSNGKTKGSGNRKNGNRYLAWAWHEAAALAIAHYPVVKAWYQHLCKNRHKQVALNALAHKLARCGFSLMQAAGLMQATCSTGVTANKVSTPIPTDTTTPAFNFEKAFGAPHVKRPRQKRLVDTAGSGQLKGDAAAGTHNGAAASQAQAINTTGTDTMSTHSPP